MLECSDEVRNESNHADLGRIHIPFPGPLAHDCDCSTTVVCRGRTRIAEKFGWHARRRWRVWVLR